MFIPTKAEHTSL